MTLSTEYQTQRLYSEASTALQQAHLMTEDEQLYWNHQQEEATKKLALHWYNNKGFDLSTIAQHFDMSYDSLALILNNVVH